MSLPQPRRRTPWWVTATIIVASLPVFTLPELLARSQGGGAEHDTVATLLHLYPAYVVLTAFLALLSWSRRPYITWILIGVMLLTHAAAWALVLTD